MTEYQKIETLYKFDNATKTYTDEFYSPYVEYLRNNKWLSSEKVDGTNVSVQFDGHRVEFHGRTERSVLSKEVLSALTEKFADSEVEFEQLFCGKPAILFMECYGGKIQGGVYGGKERLIGFDIMVNGQYLDKRCIGEIFAKFDVDCVEFKEIENLDVAINEVKSWTENTQAGISKYCEKGTTVKEGLVCVPAVRIQDNQGKRIIVKIKVKDIKKKRV